MKIDLFNFDEFVKVNNLKEVTDPVLFLKGTIPSPNGLLSTDIFGISMRDRKATYAYIDLGSNFLHPFIYKLLKRLNRNFESVIHSTKNFTIKNGVLVEDENGETGLVFLYNNWEKINFTKNDSLMRNERVDVLNAYEKTELFCSKWLVIPAFYRDVNLQNMGKGKLSHHEINDKYARLIRLTNIIKSNNEFSYTLGTTSAKIQETLVEIYDLLKSKIEKKHGMIRKNILGKSIDYGGRVVISAPTFHAESYKDMPVDLYHVGVPLSYCCSLFTPFIVAWVRNFFKREFEQVGDRYPYMEDDRTIRYVKLKDPETYFDDEMIKKQIDRFIKAPVDRFKEIEVPVEDDKLSYIHIAFTGRYYSETNPEDESTIFNRNATWCDILYQAAYEVCSDKHVYVTRYPIVDYFGTFPCKIHVMSTIETMPVMINGTVYKYYPKIDLKTPKEKVAISFLDTVTMSNVYLTGLGGDYDGDQISIKGLFTQEANKEAEEAMMSKAHLLTISGDNIRTSSKESIQTLYELTKF